MVDEIQVVLPVNESHYGFLQFDGHSKKNNWEPITFYTFNPLKRKANFYLLGSNPGVLVMDENACRELLLFWGLAGEILPATLEDGTNLFILNITEVCLVLKSLYTFELNV